MDILAFFGHFYLNHLSPLWGYFLQLSRIFICLKYLSFINLYIPHFVVESALKFSLCFLWKMVLLEVCNFQNGNQYRTLRNVSINFLLFYHNNIMLKTDIILDYW